MAGTVPAEMSPGRTRRPGDPYGGDPGPVREPSGPRPRAGPGTGPAAAAPGLEACCPAGGHRGHRRLKGAGARHSAMTNFACAAGGAEWRALGGFEEADHGAEQVFGVEL